MNEPVETIAGSVVNSGHDHIVNEHARLETVLEHYMPHWPRNPNFSDGSF